MSLQTPGASTCGRAVRTRPVDLVRRLPRRGPSAGVWRRVALQGLVVLVGFLGYSFARGFAGGDPGRALDHAHDIIGLEQALGIYREPALQQLVLEHDRILDALNSVYVWGHWPLIAAVLVWLARSHPAEFRRIRTALVLSCAVALVVYALYPVAPPRLSGIGLLDSVTERSTAYRVLQPPTFVNQYAAVPSMHMGWDVLMAIAVVRHARTRLVRGLGLLLPPLMLAAIVLTANHWFLDAVAGIVVALLGLWAADLLARRSARAPAGLVLAAAGAAAAGGPVAPAATVPSPRCPSPRS